MTMRSVLAVLVVSLSWLASGCGGEEPGAAATPQALEVASQQGHGAAVPPLAGSGGGYGTRLAIDGDRLAVGASGADPAAVHLYVRRGRTWVADGKIEGTDVDFGRNLALRGDLLAVGLPWAGAAAKGQVAIYQRHHDGWRLEATLEGPPGAAGGLGQAVVFDGGLLLVGAPGGEQPGEVLAFARGHGWRLAARIVPQVRAAFDGFGAALAADAGALAVGGWFPNPAVTVFQRGAWGMGWHQVASLVEPGPAPEPDAQFGTRLSLVDGVLAVSCSCPDGEVWVYHRRGHQWLLQAMLVAPWQDLDTGMGHDVALSHGGQRLVVTAPYRAVDGLPGVGVALVFEHGRHGWTLERTLRAPAEEADLNFGHAVGLDHGLLVVGAPGAGAGAGELVTFSLAGP